MFIASAIVLFLAIGLAFLIVLDQIDCASLRNMGAIVVSPNPTIFVLVDTALFVGAYVLNHYS